MIEGRRRARRRFGQHFLEPAWVKKVAERVHPAAGQTFIEIGPGRGALTQPLLAAGARVLAFEIDRDLAAELERAGRPGLRVISGDFLGATVNDILAALGDDLASPSRSLRVAGNLPYNVASPMLIELGRLYRSGLPIEDATVMIQRDVADRLLASPGSKQYGVLSVMVQRVADVERLLDLPPGAFRPAPQVRSTLVGLRFHEAHPSVADDAVFAALTQAIFTQRRKTLANALHAYPLSKARLPPATALALAAIHPGRRPETLSLDELGRLADIYAGAREHG